MGTVWTLEDRTGRYLKNGEPVGVYAALRGRRWEHRLFATQRLLASGMTPTQFAREFWYASDDAVKDLP